MGTNSAHLVAEFFCYERDFMMSLSDDKLILSTLYNYIWIFG